MRDLTVAILAALIFVWLAVTILDDGIPPFDTALGAALHSAATPHRSKRRHIVDRRHRRFVRGDRFGLLVRRPAAQLEHGVEYNRHDVAESTDNTANG